MIDFSQIQEHMDVVGSDDQHVGTVDNVGIKLTKADSSNDQHHYIKASQIASIEGGKVKLNMPAQQALAEYKAVEN